MRLPAMHRTVREMSVHFTQKKRYVRGVAEQVQKEARLAGMELETTDDFWKMREIARARAKWTPISKTIFKRYGKQRRRQEAIDYRLAKEKRKGAKRKGPAHGSMQSKRVRWNIGTGTGTGTGRGGLTYMCRACESQCNVTG